MRATRPPERVGGSPKLTVILPDGPHKIQTLTRKRAFLVPGTGCRPNPESPQKHPFDQIRKVQVPLRAWDQTKTDPQKVLERIQTISGDDLDP